MNCFPNKGLSGRSDHFLNTISLSWSANLVAPLLAHLLPSSLSVTGDQFVQGTKATLIGVTGCNNGGVGISERNDALFGLPPGLRELLFLKRCRAAMRLRLRKAQPEALTVARHRGAAVNAERSSGSEKAHPRGHHQAREPRHRHGGITALLATPTIAFEQPSSPYGRIERDRSMVPAITVHDHPRPTR